MTDDLAEALRMRRAALGGSLSAVAIEMGEDVAVLTQWLYRTPRNPMARALARQLSRVRD